jgi:hypothetical protein
MAPEGQGPKLASPSPVCFSSAMETGIRTKGTASRPCLGGTRAALVDRRRQPWPSRNRRASSPGPRGWVERHSSRLGSRFALRAASTHRVCAWRRPAGSRSGRISMCSLNAGRCFPQSGQRYVAGFRFCAGRTAHQRGFGLLLSLTPFHSITFKASWITQDGRAWPS